MRDWYQRIQFDRLFLLSAITTTGVLLTLRATLPLLAIASIVLVALVIAALRQVVPANRDDATWMLTPILTLASSLFWRTIPYEHVALIGSAIFGVLFLMAIMDYHQGHFSRSVHPLTWPNQAIVYIAVSMLFAAFDTWNLPLMLHTLLVAITACAASVSILFREGMSRTKIHLYSILIALVIGEITWAFIYWPLPTFQKALALLLHFHIMIGLVRAYHANRLGFTRVLEYGAVGAVVATLLTLSVVR